MVVFSTVVFDDDAGKFGKNPNFTSTSFEKEAKGNSEMAYLHMQSREGNISNLNSFSYGQSSHRSYFDFVEFLRHPAYHLPKRQGTIPTEDRNRGMK